MAAILTDIARAIAGSPASDLATHLLRNVPGLPPIVQTIHIISIAGLMASVVFIALRTLGLAVPSQNLNEMVRRLMPWTWSALPVLAISGLPFVLARPFRYFANPVFGWKMGSLAAALLLTWLMLRLIKTEDTGAAPVSQPIPVKLLAVCVLAFWVLVVLAGRWIAYAEYIFLPA